MNEVRMCYMNSVPFQCDPHCNFYDATLACPFATPRKFWDANLCLFCTKKISECGFDDRVVRSKKTDDVVGCFGFVEKKEGEAKNDF